MPEDDRDRRNNPQHETNELKRLQAEQIGAGVADTLKRLDEMSVDDYIEAVRAYFCDQATMEAFMDVLMTCKDPEMSTLRIPTPKGREITINIVPNKSSVFKKTFAKYLVIQAKLNFTLYNKDPVSYQGYMNAMFKHSGPGRRMTMAEDWFE